MNNTLIIFLKTIIISFVGIFNLGSRNISKLNQTKIVGNN